MTAKISRVLQLRYKWILMKILGIGIDIVQNKRIQNLLLKASARRFLTRVLHSQEIQSFDSLQADHRKTQYLASRWAVKEAVVKALGRKDLVFSQIKITKDANGKPLLEACNENKAILQSLKIETIHISIAHEDDYTTAQALAVCN